jgi:NAD(P)H-dependent flavin oxidoreductase YrpB (nitropropane dioxygenase family)
VPVVAAGGIMDGRELVAALALDASGVLIGTRFLVAKRVEYFQLIKKRCSLQQKQIPSLLLFTGRPARSIRNRFIEKYLGSCTKPLTWLLQALAADGILC